MHSRTIQLLTQDSNGAGVWLVGLVCLLAGVWLVENDFRLICIAPSIFVGFNEDCVFRILISRILGFQIPNYPGFGNPSIRSKSPSGIPPGAPSRVPPRIPPSPSMLKPKQPTNQTNQPHTSQQPNIQSPTTNQPHTSQQPTTSQPGPCR